MASTSSSGRRERECDPFLVLEPPNKRMKSFLPGKLFDVFINHRGPDTKTNLAMQLYSSLQQEGIQAYLDSEETELGDSLSTTIKNAIFSATVHIAILSERYAESAWCLAELALMFQTKARIIPLFYLVEPSDFRYIKNKVGEAFSKHEKQGRYPNYDIQQWKDCLQNVAGIKGYELNGQNEDLNMLCKEVVSAVKKEKQKRRIPFQVAKYEVGLDELVKDFHSHCRRNGEMKDKIIGIFGMGGSGKTTLVKALFSCKHSEFNGSTCLFDVREKHVKGELTSLQSDLLKELFHEDHHKLSSVEEGTAIIKDSLKRSRESRFLIVIDDVDHKKQLDAILPIDALDPNSLVIVTTRDERVLIQAGVRVCYKMKEMNAERSRELFCCHAFHRQSCKRGFENLVDGFVEACGGLPLALQVMGGHVYGSDKDYWKLQLDDVKARLHRDIKDRLKISYDALEEDQKQIFMDIACFFIGEKVSTAISIWKASGWRAEHALQTLKDKCLVQAEVEVEDTFWREDIFFKSVSYLRMHDHLRDLGREMAENKISHPRRLWHPQDLIGMQEIKEFQNILAGSEGKNFRCFNHICNMKYFLKGSKTSTDLQWLQVDDEYDDCMYIPEWIPVQNLQTLIVNGILPLKLWQRDDQAPLKLKELRYIFTGGNVDTEDVLLRNGSKLISSFGMLKHLESLQVKFAFQFVEWNWFLNCLKQLTSLKTLKLFCLEMEEEIALINRGETTDNPFFMKNLEAITLNFISPTRKVSISGQSCPSLRSLELHTMEDLIEVDLAGVTTLERLELYQCRKLTKVLGNDLLKLEMFLIQKCWKIKELPSFGRSYSLDRIKITGCWSLQNISAIERLKALKRISIAHCPNLQNIKAFEQLKGLKRIFIYDCPKLQNITDFKELKGLKRIFIEDCPKLQNIIGFKELKGLKRIVIKYCAKLKNIKGFKELKELKRISIASCPELQNIEGIEFLKCLESITIVSCPKLQNTISTEELKGLKEMNIADSPMISCVGKLQRLPWKLTIAVRRSAMSSLNADKIEDTLHMADDFRVIESWDQVEEKFHSFHETQHSLTKFVFCAMVEGQQYIQLSPDIKVYRGTWIYMSVVNEEMLSKYDTWMPSNHLYLEKAFIMRVEDGSERKSLDILQRLFAQLCDGDDEDEKYDGYDDEDAGYAEAEDSDRYPEDLDYTEFVERYPANFQYCLYFADVKIVVKPSPVYWGEELGYGGEESGSGDSDDEDEEYDSGNDD